MITKHFCKCGICGIGLGNYLWHEKRVEKGRKVVDRWVQVKGERKIKWKHGEVLLRYKDFRDGDLVWVEKIVSPNYVCKECLVKYKT